MGCTGSDAHMGSPAVLLTNAKPSVWLIGGGPGCQKGKICDSLIRDYKFKYLSSYDMVQFQQERGGPDAELILKLFKEKKTMPSDLIVRLVKKAIASCGIRRFLIDGFPNSVQDVYEFEKQLTSKQIDFYGYLHIQISQKKMIESGIQANSQDKSTPKSQIEQTVSQIVKAYLTQNTKIKQQYKKRNKYKQINGQQGSDKAYEQIQQYLQNINIRQPNPVKIFFSHFDDQQHQILLCDDLVRKYGLYYYTPRGLIEEALSKIRTPQAEAIGKCMKEGKEVPPSIVLGLVRKKIEKHDYKGNFLISGYPRSVQDAKQWDKFFGWQTDILGYLTFQIPDQTFKKLFTEKLSKQKPTLSPQQLLKSYTIYQQKQKQISEYYKQKQKLLTIIVQDQNKSLKQIHKFFLSKKFLPRNKISNKKLVFVNTLCGNGDVCVKVAQGKKIGVVDMDRLLEQKIRDNGLYSELIESFIRIGKPVSGIVAARVLYQRICAEPSNLIVVIGFPNSQQQLQCWQQQIGQALQLSLIVLHSQNYKYIEQTLKQKIKQKKITSNEKDVYELLKQNSNKMAIRVKNSDWKNFTINSLDDTKAVEEAFDKAGFK